MDDYGVKSKMNFDIAYGRFKNEQENIPFVREMSIKHKVVETSKVVGICQPPLLSTSAPEAQKKECKQPKKRKAKRECEIAAKNAMKKKKRDEEKARLLSKLETNDLHMKHINSNVCRKITK